MSLNTNIQNNMEETPKNIETPISVIFIMDESGSMQKMGKEPVEGLNNFVKEQKEQDKPFLYTLIFFNDKTDFKCTRIESSKIKDLSSDDYKPNGMTALNDAIGHAIESHKDIKDEKVIVIILTDGL